MRKKRGPWCKLLYCKMRFACVAGRQVVVVVVGFDVILLYCW
jgi:hypothetical protein